MTYWFYDIVDNAQKTFESMEEAQAALEAMKVIFLDKESYRFTITKETTDGLNTTWSSADLANDPEEGTYFVFNQWSGQHEKTTSKAEAVAKIEQFKQRFISELNLQVFTSDTQE
jgi:hypothetical protein